MTKVFCIGANKTGTTSLHAFFGMHGFKCGYQAQGELLMNAYANEQWKSIIEFASTADFFQDLPFSARHTYRHLAPVYPEALFILTRRSSADEWYESLIRFHAGLLTDGVRIPNRDDLLQSEYRYPGFMWYANRVLYRTPEDEPYHRHTLIRWYEDHLTEARQYFAGSNRMLEVNISDPDVHEKIAHFAGFTAQVPALPHLNKWKG